MARIEILKPNKNKLKEAKGLLEIAYPKKDYTHKYFIDNKVAILTARKKRRKN